jgi:hypothetical protein
VLSGRGLCDELITRPEESYWLWCIVVCDIETSWKRSPTGGAVMPKNKQKNKGYKQIAGTVVPIVHNFFHIYKWLFCTYQLQLFTPDICEQRRQYSCLIWRKICFNVKDSYVPYDYVPWQNEGKNRNFT